VPYGIAKDVGGDSAMNDLKVERCIEHVMAKNPKLSKQSAIRICKDSIQEAARARAKR
jgi:hypothetical protein